MRGPRLTTTGKQRAELNAQLGEVVAVQKAMLAKKTPHEAAVSVFDLRYRDKYAATERLAVKMYFADHPTCAAVYVLLSEEECELFTAQLIDKLNVRDF